MPCEYHILLSCIWLGMGSKLVGNRPVCNCFLRNVYSIREIHTTPVSLQTVALAVTFSLYDGVKRRPCFSTSVELSAEETFEAFHHVPHFYG